MSGVASALPRSCGKGMKCAKQVWGACVPGRAEEGPNFGTPHVASVLLHCCGVESAGV